MKIITHFSNPNWPMVNKLRIICKSLDVAMIHCSSREKLLATFASCKNEKCLFFTDEALLETVQQFDAQSAPSFEVALFIISPIGEVAEKISDLRRVKYLIGLQPVDSIGRDLSILVKKFADGDILDLNKYLSYGCKINNLIVNGSDSKRAAIEAVSNYILSLGDPGYHHPFGEYAARMAELADELLLNAVFNANPRMRNADRSKAYELRPAEQIQMSFGYDGEYFGISVRDPFGKFTSETIMKYLSMRHETNRITMDASGGLGLKFIFEKAHQVVTNVKDEQVTEVIALVKLVNRMLEFDLQKKSFFFFGEKPNNPTA